MRMERNGGVPAPSLALVAVWLLCCAASAAYSVPADPRRQPSPGPGRGGYRHGPAPAASPRPHHHHRQHGHSPAPASPHHAPSPSPTAGADGLPSSRPPLPVYTRAPEPQATTTPHFGFPLEPTVGVSASGPSGALPKKGDGEGYPFIGSNPTVPLPTGVTDTATVRPLPDTTRADDNAKVAGRAAEPVRAGGAMIGLLMAVLSTVALLLSSWS
ncbi:hypothetical protein VPH35_063747 [Triticum aestivum]|uniref:IQ motif and SEC7 domain-containing protein 2 n=1 Tax=Triticum aestivum TaxID=4565 RepID=UPI0001BA9332|nr:IQ motif and SEC7 domain-containing protein 2-like [Triticum aestivum]